MASITITGLDELEKALKENVTMNDVKRVVKTHGSQLQRNMQNKADFKMGYQTGTTKRSIGLEIADGGFTANVGPETEYSPYLEYGTRFMDAIAQYHLDGNGRKGKQLPTYFHTSHPQLCAALRRSDKWVQVSARLYGDNKKRNAESMRRSELKNGRKLNGSIQSSGFGGHFRAVQGFKYIGGAIPRA